LKVMHRKCDCLPVDPVQHMYFILRGMNPDQEPTFQVDLIWNRKKLPQLDQKEIKTAFIVALVFDIRDAARWLTGERSILVPQPGSVHGQAQLVDLAVERLAVNAQQLGRLGLVAVGLGQGLLQVFPGQFPRLGRPQGHLVR